MVFTDDVGHRDSHGMAVTHDSVPLGRGPRGEPDRGVRRPDQWAPPADSLVSALSDDPTPDLVDIAPTGDLMFVTLRGPNPLTGDPHVSTGTTPGLAVMEVGNGGRTGVIRKIVRISNINAGGVERADPHGIRVRVK